MLRSVALAILGEHVLFGVRQLLDQQHVVAHAGHVASNEVPKRHVIKFSMPERKLLRGQVGRRPD